MPTFITSAYKLRLNERKPPSVAGVVFFVGGGVTIRVIITYNEDTELKVYTY